MGRAIAVKTDYSGAEVRRLAKRTKDAAQARRLLAVAAILDGASREEAAKTGGMDRQTLRDWVIRFNEQGPDGLINIASPGAPAKLDEEHKAFLARIVDEGPTPAIHGVVRWRACDLIMRLYEEFALSVSDDTIYRAMKELGFSHVSARPKAYKQDAEAMDAFKKTFPHVAEIRKELAPSTSVEVWFQDEMRVGQKNKITYRWARTGSRPRADHDQRTQSAYLFGAVCPERGTGAALVLPACNTQAMQLHLEEIATEVAPVLTPFSLDQAGWHGAKDLRVPRNISLLPLPLRSPELNPQENIWQTVCSLSVRMGLVHAMRRARIASDGPAPILTHRGRAMQQNIRVFVGLDTSKMKISVALAEDGRQGEVRFLGDINNTPDAVKRLVIKLTGKYQKLLFCYEAGPTGYGLHSCVKIGYRTASLNPSTTFSITAATLGGRSSINLGKSCLSLAAIGQPSVSQSEDWYQT